MEVADKVSLYCMRNQNVAKNGVTIKTSLRLKRVCVLLLKLFDNEIDCVKLDNSLFFIVDMQS